MSEHDLYCTRRQHCVVHSTEKIATMGTAGKLSALFVVLLLAITCVSGVCDKARYDLCVSDVNTRTSLLISASGILQQFALGILNNSTLSLYCGSWENFTVCVSNTGCTFQDIYSLTTDTYARRYLINTVNAYTAICSSSLQAHLTCLNTVQCGLERCQVIFDVKLNYYYNYNNYYYSVCSSMTQFMQCQYKAMRGSCANATALSVFAATKCYVIRNYLNYYSISTECEPDFNQLLNYVPPVSGCDYERYFYNCSNSASNLLVGSSESTAQLISSGSTSAAQRSAYCSTWSNLTLCTGQSGCSFTDIYDHLNQLQNIGDRFNKIVRWWQFICNSQAFAADVDKCYASNTTRAGFARCYGARLARQNYPFYMGTCQAVFYELQCFYTTALAASNDSVALSVTSIRLYATLLSCDFDLSTVTSSIEPAGSCDKDSFLSCSYQYVSVLNSASSYFYNFVRGQLTSSVRSQICRSLGASFGRTLQLDNSSSDFCVFSSWVSILACFNATGCTLDEIDQHVAVANSYYQQHYVSAYRSLQIMCETPSAADFVNCFNQSAVQVGFQRCANIASAKQQHPYYVDSFDQCGFLYGSLKCNYRAMTSICNNQTVLGILTSMVEYDLVWTRTACPLSVERVVNYMPTSAGTCDEDSFYTCVYQYPRMASYYAQQSNLNQLIQAQLSSSQLMSLCSEWNNYTLCVNNSRCSFEYIASRIYSSYQRDYNLSISVNKLICKSTVTQGILQCVNSTAAQLGIQRCVTILTTKTNYPYYINSYDCYSYLESVACNYEVFKPICSNASVVDAAKLTATNIWWQRYSNYYYGGTYSSWINCQSDESQLANLTNSATTCDYDSYFVCCSNFNYWSSNSQTYLSQLVSGQLPTVCRSWTNFTDCVNKSRCSFNDVYSYMYRYESYYANQLSQSVQFSSFVCSQQNQDQLLSQSCLMSARVQSGISRCDTIDIASARQNYPYYIWSSTCQNRLYTAACYAKVILAECNSSVAQNFVAFVLRAEDIRQGYCSLDASAIIANYTSNPVSTCDEFFYCHTKETVLSSMYSSTFRSWTQGRLDTYNVASYCSSWSRLAACVNTSGCTFDDAAKLMQYYYVAQLNSSIRSVTYMCSRLAEYATVRRCNLAGRTTSCDTIIYNQQSYPYYNLYTNTCRNHLELASRVFKFVSPVCSRADSVRAAQYRLLYYEIWVTPACTIDAGQILTTIPAANASCSMTRYLSCLVETSNLQSYFYQRHAFQSLLGGSLSFSTLTSYCLQLESLNQCVGCRADNDNFPTTALGLDRYMFDTDNYITPRRLSGMCGVSSQDYATFQNCFSAHDLYGTLQTCQYRAAVLRGTADRDCRYHIYRLRCFYDEASSVCSTRAAKYATDYLLNALPQYLNYTYGCTIVPSDVYTPCDGPGCMYELSTVVPRYITALQTGRLTANDLEQLCTHTTSAVACLTTNVRASCPVQPANYDMLSNQVLPFVCDFPNIKQYETYQRCFLTSSSSQLIVSRYFDSNATCASSKSSLASLYTSLSTPCASGTASAVVTYTSLLRTVRTLANNETDNCTSALYPTTNAVPRFLGPFFVDSNDPYNPYIDFYFVCRVNYTLQLTDDGARFDVSLSSNDQPSSTFKTTTSMELNVTFTSKELPKYFYGTEVSCAVRSYWVQVPTVKSVSVFSSSSYFVGIRYWTDISSGGDVTIAESSPLVPIYFQATVPLSCDINLKLFKNAGLFVSECSLTFSASDPPRTSRTLYVRAVPTAGSNYRILKLNFSPVTTLCTGSPWNKYQQSTIPVVVTDSLFSGSCSSDGDPHIRTFDGRFYSVYFAGDFLLWKSYSTTLVEVHVRHQRCAIQTVSCNCAVAFREGNNILGVYACDPNRPPVAIRYLTDPDQPARDVQISSNGLSFTITMPSGRYMTVRTGCAYCQRLAIVIYPISEDISRSTGLCGNYNGYPDDDTVPKGDIFPDRFLEPVLFTRSYMLREGESLINAHKFSPTCQPKTVVQPQICKCNDLGIGKSADKCDLSNVNGASSKSAVTFVTYSTDLCSSGARRKREAVSGTSQNVIGPDELPPEDPGTPPDTPMHPDVEANNQTNIDITTARALCQEPLERSAIYRQCSSYTTETKDAIIDSCSLDVQLTGDPEAVLNVILARYSEACIRGVQESDTRSLEEAVQLYNETSDDNDTEPDTGSSIAPTIISPEILAVLEAIAQQVCPGQPTECSGNGTCQNSTCICFPGRIGVDCSLSDDVAPRITDLRYGATCIVREGQPCSSVSLFVRDVVYSENFTCKVICSGQTYYTSYQPASGGEVHCQLPLSPGDAQSTNPSYRWSVSVSNNNKTFSNAVELFVYDSKCVDCNNVTFACERKNGTCLIDGKCYVRDELSPTDPCLRCDPQLNSTAWRQDPPSACATTSRPQTTTNAPIRDTTVGMTGLPISSARTIAVTNAQSTISAVAGVSSLPRTTVPAFSTSAIVQDVTSQPLSSIHAGGVTSLASTAAQNPGVTTAAVGSSTTAAGGPSTANPAAAASSSSLMSADGATAPTTAVAGSQTATTRASASSTKGQEVTTAGNVYGTWGEWSPCTSGCTNRTSSRTRTCRAGSSCPTAHDFEIRTCLTQECPESADEKPQGVILITKLDFSKKIQDPAELSDFISKVDNVINVFCNANRGRKFYCCKYRYQSSDTTLQDPVPDSAAIDFVTERLTSVGNGFPRELVSTAEVKLLFRALRPGLDRQCSAGSSATRRKRQSTSDIAYLNKTLMAEALNANIASSNLSDVQSASPAPDATPTKGQSSTDVVKIVVPVVVGGVVAVVLAFCALRFIRRSKSRSKNVDAPVGRQDNRFGAERVFAVRPLRAYYQPQYRYRNNIYVQ